MTLVDGRSFFFFRRTKTNPLLSSIAPAVQPSALRDFLVHSEGDLNAGLEWRIYRCIVHRYARRVTVGWKLTNEAVAKR